MNNRDNLPTYPQAVHFNQEKGHVQVPITQVPMVQHQMVQYGGPNQPATVQVNVARSQPFFREFPIRTICPYCNLEVLTTTESETGTYTWLMCFVIAILGGCLGCCLIPFFIDQCRNTVHSCPRCEQPIGRFDRSNQGYNPQYHG